MVILKQQLKINRQMDDRIETDLQIIQNEINKAKHSNTKDQYLKTIDFLFIEILKHRLK